MIASECHRMIVPAKNAIIEKAFQNKSLDYNLIYADVSRDLTTNALLQRTETCTTNFRKEVYDELKEMNLNKLYDFQSKIIDIEENKKRLESRRARVKARIDEGIPFIEENNYRYLKTVESIKNDIQMTKIKRKELLEINKEIESLTDKFIIKPLMTAKKYYIPANKQLKNYENFLIEALKILPEDYVKGLKENNMSALIRRCRSLFYINKILNDDLNRSSVLIRKYVKDLDVVYQKLSSLQAYQSLVFPKLNNELLDYQNVLSIKQTKYSDSYVSLRQKLHKFGIMLQSINNITNKAFQILEKGFYCELELNLIPKIMSLDPDTKFMRIEEFISCASQILDLIESKSTIS